MRADLFARWAAGIFYQRGLLGFCRCCFCSGSGCGLRPGAGHLWRWPRWRRSDLREWIGAPGSSSFLKVSFIAELGCELASVGWAPAHAAADRVRIACAWCSGSSVSGIALPLPFFVVVFSSSLFVIVLDSSEAGSSDFLLTLPCAALIGIRGFKGNSYKPV